MTEMEPSSFQADRAEFRRQYGFDRPHVFQPLYQLAGGGVKFTAGHERLPVWTFTIQPRNEEPAGYTIDVFSIAQNPMSADESGEQIYGPPTLQHIDLGVVSPTMAAAIDVAKFAVDHLIRDLEREAWEDWRLARSVGNADSSRN